MCDETWRKIPGLPDWLEVSNKGRTRSLEHTAPSGKGKIRRCLGKYLSLKPVYINGKYPCLQWREQDGTGRHRVIPVHKAVLLAFVGLPPTKQHEACHGDGNPQNNAVENLRWGLRSENIADTVRHGKIPPQASLSPTDIHEIRQRTANGEKQASVAAAYNTAQSNVSLIANRKRWKWLPAT